MRIHNLHADENGVSHFRDSEVEWSEERRAANFPNAYVLQVYDQNWQPALTTLFRFGDNFRPSISVLDASTVSETNPINGAQE